MEEHTNQAVEALERRRVERKRRMQQSGDEATTLAAAKRAQLANEQERRSDLFRARLAENAARRRRPLVTPGTEK